MGKAPLPHNKRNAYPPYRDHYLSITTWLEALLVNMNKLVLMFHGKFSCIKTINVIKKKIVQIRPLTAEIIKIN